MYHVFIEKDKKIVKLKEKGDVAADRLRSLREEKKGTKASINELIADWSKRMETNDAKWTKRMETNDAKWTKRMENNDAKWTKRMETNDAKWTKRMETNDAKWTKRMETNDAKWEIRHKAGIDELRFSNDKLIARMEIMDAKWTKRMETNDAKWTKRIETNDAKWEIKHKAGIDELRISNDKLIADMDAKQSKEINSLKNLFTATYRFTLRLLIYDARAFIKRSLVDSRWLEQTTLFYGMII